MDNTCGCIVIQESTVYVLLLYSFLIMCYFLIKKVEPQVIESVCSSNFKPI